MNGMPDIDDDTFRRYAIRSNKNPDIILCWSESRTVADRLSQNHIVTRTPDGVRIFPQKPVVVPLAYCGLSEARVG